MNKRCIPAVVFTLIYLSSDLSGRVMAVAAHGEIIRQLSEDEAWQIGELVFRNECGSKDENLVAWNEGEDFISLGIGHFIWHPAKNGKIFEESFTRFLEYAKASGEKIPSWLDKDPLPACPWDSRDNFLRMQSDIRLTELKEFLVSFYREAFSGVFAVYT